MKGSILPQLSICQQWFVYVDYADPGRFRLTELESDWALFGVPSLRNIAVTAPYMHDGPWPPWKQWWSTTIEGGMPHPNKSSLLKPLGLSPWKSRNW
ncbi:MAG: hypothetical protein IPL65_17165 [Lewinellaceae bacterium]|nr:hypothetical protein [Lewinellaceae bacterium]